MNVRTLLTVLTLGATGAVTLAAPVEALAQDPKTAEKLRLEEEMKKLAAKNAWTGVERSYQALVDLNVPLTQEDHLLGSQAARFLGKTFEMYNRLQKAKELGSTAEIDTELGGIEQRYGFVDIKGNPRKPQILSVAAMPFSPDERKSIEWANTVLTNTGSFHGMLPIDVEYQIGGQTFSAKTGPDWQNVVLGKAPKTATPTTEGGEGTPTPQPQPEGVGLVVYSGPIAMLGYNYMSSSAPTAAPEDGYEAHPDDVSGSGIAGEVGAEIGFTKVFGVAGTLGYDSLFSQDVFHGFNGWFAVALRPGELRVAAGPTYGVIMGSGTGVATWWETPSEEQYPARIIEYKGRSTAGGARFTVGYGLVDFGDKLRGSVELGAAWQTDGERSWMNAGLRVGVVPKIKRFKATG